MRADVARNSVLVLSAILLGNVFNYVYYVLLGRSVSLRDYGSVMSLVSAILLAFGVGSIVQTIVAKVAADLRAAGDPRRMDAFSRGILRSSLFMGSAILVAAILLRGIVARYLHLERPELVAVAGATAAIGFPVLFQRGLFQGFGSFKRFAISSSLDGAKAFFILPLAARLGALGALSAYLAAGVLSAGYGAVMLRKRFSTGPLDAGLDFRRLLRTAGATGGASISIVVLMFYDVVLAKHYVTPGEASLYSAAALAGRVLLAACSFLPIVLLPDIAQRSASGRPDRHVLGATVGIALGIIGVALIACALEPALLLRILAGRAFERAAPLLLLYVAASAGLALANLLVMYAIARHRFSFTPYVALAALCEIVAVLLRHGTSMQIVQDVVAGHLAVCVVMVVWVVAHLVNAPVPGPQPRAIHVHTR